MAFHFVANVKPYTVQPGRGVRRFNSYLLSIDYYRDFASLARLVTQDRRVLVADNGNVARIRTLIT